MTAGQRAWIQSVLPVWKLKLEEHVLRGAPLYRVIGLESVIARLEAQLAEPDDVPAPVPVLGVVELIAVLEARLRIVSPRPHPHYPAILMNTGPIMAAVCHDLETRLAALKGEAAPAAPEPSFRERMRARDLDLGPPANDPEPFAAGEQMGMFG